MSSKTTNYNLHKIDLTDSPPDITVLNENFNIIDEELSDAVSKSGDTMTGNLKIERDWATLVLGDGTERTVLLEKNPSTSHATLYTYKDSENHLGLVLAPETDAVTDSLILRRYVNGAGATYKIYGEHNKPTPAEIDAFGMLTDSTGTDLNTFISMGSKRVVSAINKPNGTGGYGLVWNITNSNGWYLIQYYLDANTRNIYRRCHIDGTWTSWLAEASTTVVAATVE